MVRLSLGLILASIASHAACAGDGLPNGQAGAPRTSARCAALGEGFFPVAGSDACIKISGHISAGVGFGSGGGASSGPHFGGAPSTSFDTETAVTGDMRFDTPLGPARIYAHVRKDSDPRWNIDNQ